MKRNYDYAAHTPNSDISIYFYIESERSKMSEVSTELLEIYGDMFEEHDDFVRPRSVSFTIAVFSEDYDVYEDVDLDIEPLRATDCEVEWPDLDRKFQEAYERVETDGTETKYVSEIRSDDVATKIWLPDGDEFLTADHDRYRYDSARHIDEDPDPEAKGYPLEIALGYADEARVAGYESEYWLRIWSNTDVWFEDTEVGERNRSLLAELFEYLAAEYEIADATYSGPVYFPQDRDGLDSIRPENYINTSPE